MARKVFELCCKNISCANSQLSKILSLQFLALCLKLVQLTGCGWTTNVLYHIQLLYVGPARLISMFYIHVQGC
ncbi:hypothetical protein XELAEV_18041182mg [Xenopus laevis]|uniref:Uncharacterized protein n=1 Tax=Xenopus laevis TaxID=8355 RepID=A0A974C1P2_XENLA|nr:hypothetical protein XELAEV_18041182mg [Xenopus laevis]